ncbi:hypothetical protein GCM10009619_18340 [Williamsia maris]
MGAADTSAAGAIIAVAYPPCTSREDQVADRTEARSDGGVWTKCDDGARRLAPFGSDEPVVVKSFDSDALHRSDGRVRINEEDD